MATRQTEREHYRAGVVAQAGPRTKGVTRPAPVVVAVVAVAEELLRDEEVPPMRSSPPMELSLVRVPQVRLESM